MVVQHVDTDAAFEREMLAAEGRLVVVDFFATWCGPCRHIAPVLERLSDEFTAVRFLKVDVDLCPDTAASQSISAMPTFKFFVRGAEFDMLRGADAQALEQKVRKYAETVERETGGQVLSNTESDMWFDGDVKSALDTSRQNNALLLVFVRDEAKNDAKKTSARMAAMLNDDEISRVCKDAGVVAMRLTAGTVPASQFGQVFPVVVLPTVFLLSSTGTPLEVIAGCPPDLNKAVLGQKLRKAIDMQREQSGGADAKAADGAAAASTSDKVQRAKVLLEQKKAMREAEEMEATKERERKRREEGRGVQEFKQSQEEREAKELAAERRQTKQADKAYLKRLREQIAADREDKVAQSADAPQPDAVSARLEKQKKMEEEARRLAENSNTARIQCRFPDASTEKRSFDPDLTTLAEVAGWISTVRPDLGQFTLALMYPRREFGDEHMPMTLRDLQLCPSATLVVITKAGLARKPTPLGWSEALSEWARWPFELAYGCVMGAYVWLFDNRPRPAVAAPAAAGTAGNRDGGGAHSSRMGRMSDLDAGGSTPDKDDNATWNGNSTQQL